MVTEKNIDQLLQQVDDAVADFRAANSELKRLPMGEERAQYQRQLDELALRFGLELSRSNGEQRGAASWLARAAECRHAAGLYRKAGDRRRASECEHEATDAERKAAFIRRIDE